MPRYNIVSAGSMVTDQPEDVSVILANLEAIQAILNGHVDAENIDPATVIVTSPYQILVGLSVGTIGQVTSQLMTLFNTLVGGSSFGGSPANGAFTTPPQVLTPGVIVAGTDAIVEVSGIVPSTADNLDVFLRGFVTNNDGTEVARIDILDSVPSPVTDTAKTVNLTGAMWTILAGADLSDGGGGDLVSAAGGVYSTLFSGGANWD